MYSTCWSFFVCTNFQKHFTSPDTGRVCALMHHGSHLACSHGLLSCPLAILFSALPNTLSMLLPASGTFQCCPSVKHSFDICLPLALFSAISTRISFLYFRFACYVLVMANANLMASVSGSVDQWWKALPRRSRGQTQATRGVNDPPQGQLACLVLLSVC